MSAVSQMALLSAGASAVSDPLFASVVLLAHFDGTNGATTFTDNSSYARTLTAVGSAALTTSSPLRGAASLNLGGADNVTFAAAAELGLSADFCLEFLIKTSTTSLDGGYYRNAISYGGDFASATGFALAFGDSGGVSSNLTLATNGANVITGTQAVATGSSVHVALDRSGSSLKLWVGGVQSGSTATNSTNFSGATSVTSVIGGRNSTTGRLIGVIDELRITKASRYQSSFTPPAALFPNF